MSTLPVPVVAARRRWGVRRRRRRGGSPQALPAAAVRLGLQIVHEAHRQLDVGALVAVYRVRPPALKEAVNEVAHAAAVLAGEQVTGEDELGVPAIVSGRQLLVQVLQVSKQFLATCARTYRK